MTTTVHYRNYHDYLSYLAYLNAVADNLRDRS